MDKILVTVYAATIDESFDIFVPINLKVKVATDLIQKVINGLSDENYLINENALLYDAISGYVININNIVKDSGMVNGGKLLLI